MTRDGPDAQARARSRRRDQAAAAAAKAGGALSLAVVLLGAPTVVSHHPSPASHLTTTRGISRAEPDPPRT